jgi:hypothetical protein
MLREANPSDLQRSGRRACDQKGRGQGSEQDAEELRDEKRVAVVSSMTLRIDSVLEC